MQHANITGSETVCSWSLLLLHNTVGGVLWTARTMPCIVLVINSFTNVTASVKI